MGVPKPLAVASKARFMSGKLVAALCGLGQQGVPFRGWRIDAQERVLVSVGPMALWGYGMRRRGRLLQQLHGHSGAVQCVAISTRGDRAVSAGVDRTIRVWDVATGEQLHILVGHDRPVNCLAITPDGGSIISGSDVKRFGFGTWLRGTLVNNLMAMVAQCWLWRSVKMAKSGNRWLR